MIFPFDTPFNGDITNLNTSLDKTFFELGKKYVVNLNIISENEREPEKTVVVVVPFVLTMNSYPINGTLNVVPEVGLYNTTTFLISSLNWVDDTTDQLEYKFYAIEKGTAMVQELRGWSHLNEVTSNFTTMQYQNPTVNIIIYCEIRDNYNATIKVSKEVVLANSLQDDTYNLEKAVLGYFTITDAEGKEYPYESVLKTDIDKQFRMALQQANFSDKTTSTAVINYLL
jgi:hypothetical protein